MMVLVSYNGAMGSFQRSWELTKQSWKVLRDNPSLIWFPIVSSVSAILLSATFFLPLYAAIGLKNVEHPPTYAYPVIFLYYLVSYCVIVFFNAGLVYCANESLHGRPTSFGDGVNASLRRLGAILGWALVAATIGMILRLLSERLGFIGQIVVALLGGAWNIVTFFAVPILVLDGVGPLQAVRGSWETIKKTWGETLIGNAGVGLALMLLALWPIVPFIAVCFTANAVLIVGSLAVMLIYWCMLGAVGSSMSGIYSVAVFSYARTGSVPSGFSPEAIQAAFLEKPKSKLAFWKK